MSTDQFIPDEAIQKLDEICNKYKINIEKLVDMFIDKFYSEFFISQFPNDSERAKAVVNAIELDIRSSIRGEINNIEEYEVLPIGIQQLGRSRVRLLSVIENKPAIISFKSPQLNELNKAIQSGSFKLFRKYTFRLRKARNIEGLYFPAFDIDFSDIGNEVDIDPIDFYRKITNVKEVKIKDVIKNGVVDKSVLSEINERGYANIWDLRLFRGYLVERTRSGFRFDDYSIMPEDFSRYYIDEGKYLNISKTTVIMSCHSYFVREVENTLKKIPPDIVSSVKPFVTVLGTLELRQIQIPDIVDVEMYRLHINAVYLKVEKVI